MNAELSIAQAAVEKTSYAFSVYDVFVIVLFIAVSALLVVDAMIPWLKELHKKNFYWRKGTILNAISVISKIAIGITIVSCIIYALIADDNSFTFIFSVIFLPVAIAAILFAVFYFICLFIYKFIYEPIKWQANKLKK